MVGKAGLGEKKKEEILVFPLIVSLITNSNGQDVQANAHEEASCTTRSTKIINNSRGADEAPASITQIPGESAKPIPKYAVTN